MKLQEILKKIKYWLDRNKRYFVCAHCGEVIQDRAHSEQRVHICIVSLLISPIGELQKVKGRKEAELESDIAILKYVNRIELKNHFRYF
jgi:hypothetical protein